MYLLKGINPKTVWSEIRGALLAFCVSSDLNTPLPVFSSSSFFPFPFPSPLLQSKMSEPIISDSNSLPQDPAVTPGLLPDDPPMLKSDEAGTESPERVEEAVDGDRPEPGTESPEKEAPPNARFEPGVVIVAEPISMLRPGEESVEAAPRSAGRRRNPEEMAKRPSWLPEDWKIDLRVRSSGATAGLIDRYFIEPTGQRRFRSKIEVERFLETGSKIKRKPTSEADDEASEIPSSPPKKSGKKGKKAKAVANGDGENA